GIHERLSAAVSASSRRRGREVRQRRPPTVREGLVLAQAMTVRQREMGATFAGGWTRWVWFVLGWALLSLVFVPEVYLYFLYRSEAMSWTHAVALALANAGIAFVFLPPIVWLTRRAPVERRTWRRALLVHVPACLAFAVGH